MTHARDPASQQWLPTLAPFQVSAFLRPEPPLLQAAEVSPSWKPGLRQSLCFPSRPRDAFLSAGGAWTPTLAASFEFSFAAASLHRQAQPSSPGTASCGLGPPVPRMYDKVSSSLLGQSAQVPLCFEAREAPCLIFPRVSGISSSEPPPSSDRDGAASAPGFIGCKASSCPAPTLELRQPSTSSVPEPEPQGPLPVEAAASLTACPREAS